MDKLIMTKKGLLDKIQDCVDDISVRLLISKEDGDKGKGNVAAHSDEWDRTYVHDELVDRLSIELKREVDKIIVLPNGTAELYICDNEEIVKKFRNKARYEVYGDEEYDSLVAQAANELGITKLDSNELLGGYGVY